MWWLNPPRCTLLLVPNVRFSVRKNLRECVDSFCTGQKGIYELSEHVLHFGSVHGEETTASSQEFLLEVCDIVKGYDPRHNTAPNP